MSRENDVALALSFAGITAYAIGRIWADHTDDQRNTERVTIEIE